MSYELNTPLAQRLEELEEARLKLEKSDTPTPKQIILTLSFLLAAGFTADQAFKYYKANHTNNKTLGQQIIKDIKSQNCQAIQNQIICPNQKVIHKKFPNHYQLTITTKDNLPIITYFWSEGKKDSFTFQINQTNFSCNITDNKIFSDQVTCYSRNNQTITNTFDQDSHPESLLNHYYESNNRPRKPR